jgi:nucleoside-diphosphate-sugar epimerase
MNWAVPIDMTKSILITGSDGFTGQHFARAAEDRSYHVYSLKADLLKPQDIANELTGKTFDYVVHLAAISAVTHADELALYQVNLFGTLNLLQVLTSQTPLPSKIIVASSANIYGNAAKSPISESAVPAPINHYAMSKLAMEHMIRKYQGQLPLVTVRPFNYTGAGQDDRFLIPKLVNHFIEKKAHIELGNIDVEREFNDVRTVCEAYLGLLTDGVADEAYNVCSGTTYSLTQVIEILTRLTGHELEIRVNPDFVRENEVHRLCGSPEKLEACLGDLGHRGLEDTLEWMLNSAGP